MLLRVSRRSILGIGFIVMILLIYSTSSLLLYWRRSCLEERKRFRADIAGLALDRASEADVRKRYGEPYMVITGDKIMEISRQFVHDLDQKPLHLSEISHALFYRDTWYTILVYVDEANKVVDARIGSQ